MMLMILMMLMMRMMLLMMRMRMQRWRDAHGILLRLHERCGSAPICWFCGKMRDGFRGSSRDGWTWFLLDLHAVWYGTVR